MLSLSESSSHLRRLSVLSIACDIQCYSCVSPLLLLPARPCQRCIKRGIASNCTEGHRKKAKYLLDDEELGMRPFRHTMPFIVDEASYWSRVFTEAMKRTKGAENTSDAKSAGSEPPTAPPAPGWLLAWPHSYVKHHRSYLM